MSGYHLQLAQKYRQAGIVVDTNLLILLIVGTCDIKRITKFKRTNKYMEDDYELLARFVRFFDNIVTSPNILTEACNLCQTLNAETDHALYRAFSQIIASLNECYVASVNVLGERAFFTLGISGSVILDLCKQGRLLLTDDLPLYGYITSLGLDAVNFNHVRTLSWNS